MGRSRWGEVEVVTRWSYSTGLQVEVVQVVEVVEVVEGVQVVEVVQVVQVR